MIVRHLATAVLMLSVVLASKRLKLIQEWAAMMDGEAYMLEQRKKTRQVLKKRLRQMKRSRFNADKEVNKMMLGTTWTDNTVRWCRDKNIAESSLNTFLTAVD